MSWGTVLLLSVVSYALKAAGLLVLRTRSVPEAVLRFVALLPPSLLMALIVVQTFAGQAGALEVDARAAGLLAAGVAVWRRAPFLIVVLSGATTAAVLRAVA